MSYLSVNNHSDWIASLVVLPRGTSSAWRIEPATVDYTIPLNNLLSSAKTQAEDHRCMNWTQYVAWCNEYFRTPSLSDHLAMQISSFWWFYNQVKTGGPWDIKQKDSWEAALPNVPYLGRHTGYFSFRGHVIMAADMGNIMYGYVGRAAGFSDVTLFWGGGVAQQESINNPAVITPPLYGDTQEDHDMIVLGFNMFNSAFPSYPAVGYSGIPVEPGILAAIADLLLN